jgi:hypothetical protein
MQQPTPKPATMVPGARNVTGSGLAPNAYGMQLDEIGEFVPADVNLHPSGPPSVSYYNGATPPPVGGGGRAAKAIKSGPMGR